MNRALLMIGAALLPTAAAGQGDSSPYKLALVCSGDGSANKPTNSTIFAQQDGQTATASVMGTRSVGFGDQVNLEIEGTEGRIRMPRAMLPPVRGGENGWFRIRDIEIGENEITGSVAVNFMNNPKVRIDRITGAISISGKAGDYAGTCMPYDPETVERAF